MGIKMKKMMTVPKTIEGLRDAIFDEINQLRSGKGNLQQARAVAADLIADLDVANAGNRHGVGCVESRRQ